MATKDFSKKWRPKPSQPSNGNHQATAAKDRLSGLPDHVLHKILALLPFDDSVRLSALSARWRRVWSTNPTLRFYITPSIVIALGDFPVVDHCLLLASRIEKLRSVAFTLRDVPHPSSALRRWIRFAADRDIEELAVSGASRSEIPRVLFECRSLSTLKLSGFTISSSSVKLGLIDTFKWLKTLVLAYVDVGNDTLNALLALCPGIETLAISGCRKLTRVAILSPTMRSLTLKSSKGLDQFEVVWAPQLRRLMYDGDLLKVKSLEGLGNLEEAAILSSKTCPFENRQRWKRFISTLAHVKILSVNSWFFEFPFEEEHDLESRAVFNNLKEFHWWPVYKTFPGASWSAEDFTEASVHALISTLQYCPSLELLCMHCNYYMGKDDHLCDHLDAALSIHDHCGTHPLQKFNKANCLLPHLRKVKVLEFSCKKEEVQLVKFLLSEAVQLESVILYYAEEEKDKLGEMHRVIGSLHKASNHVRVSLYELPHDACPKHDSIWWQFTDF